MDAGSEFCARSPRLGEQRRSRRFESCLPDLETLDWRRDANGTRQLLPCLISGHSVRCETREALDWAIVFGLATMGQQQWRARAARDKTGQNETIQESGRPSDSVTVHSRNSTEEK